MSLFVTRLQGGILSDDSSLDMEYKYLTVNQIGVNVNDVKEYFGRIDTKFIQDLTSTDGVKVYECYTGRVSLFLRHYTVLKIAREYGDKILSKNLEIFITEQAMYPHM